MNKRILLVDDSPVMRTLIKEVLRSDYTVTTAADGLEALEVLLRGESLDAIVVDLSMPRMGGVELLQRMRAMRAYATLPVLVLSGHYESEKRIAAIQAGANDFMTKPFNPLELKLRLDRLVPKQQKRSHSNGLAKVMQLRRRDAVLAN